MLLLDRHPRDTWIAQRSSDADFWLEIHDGFRRACGAVAAAVDEHRGAQITTLELAVRSAPRLRGLLAQLHGHHQVEDFNYFPALRRAEPRLGRGFDALERDHATLRDHADAALASLDALLAAAGERDSGDAPRHAAGRYAAASGRFCGALARHLADEEDLVVPLLLELRGK